MSLDIHRNNKVALLFQVCMVRHDWACPEWCKIVSQLHPENESRYEVVGFFCMVLDIRCSRKFVQLFQVGLVKYTHSDSKQRVSYITKIAEVWSRFFACSLTYKNASFWFSPFIHSYGCGQAHLGMLKVIPTVESAICQDWIELWCRFFVYE